MRISNDTSATALTAPTLRCSMPLVTGNSFTRLLARSTTAPGTISSTNSATGSATGSTTVSCPATVFSCAPTG